MFFARRPSDYEIARFLEHALTQPLSYSPAGLTRSAVSHGRLDVLRAPIGRGAADFERARDALMAWKHFDLPWVQLFPRHAPIDVGTVVAVCVQHLGFWSLNGARVVYRLDDATRVGFAYGTLTNHAENGEELFEVFGDAKSDEVIYRIRAVSWPQAALAWIGYPFVRHLQARFRRDSVAAMRRVTGYGRPSLSNRR
ncbi:MAG TPA: DUF1990 domain-containing protein [Vicinamibacterales bacterium]|jgi:uncharacterized protein (UPF0548 family)|nr:DUF1990 domain-containing protein [Vicinamibacterales bacterium]